MESVDVIVSILLPIAGLWLASMEYRMRSLADKLASTATKREITEEIIARQAVQKAIQGELKEDMKRVEDKLDKLFEMLVKHDSK